MNRNQFTKSCTFKRGAWNCGSYQFNLQKNHIEQGDLCDVHYWQTQAQRPWVGLTGDEIEDLPKDKTWWEIIRAAEEILKEKNT